MNAATRQFDVIVLGAGAAGLMCAATAGQRGRRVALLEHNGQPGRKILISGGGRCNFTNLHCGPENFISENPHFAKSALALYEPRHFIELVERYGIAWHEKTLGQLFCDGSARAIVEMLLAECERGGVEMVLNARGIEVESAAGGGFRVMCSQGEFAAGALVVATGGLSIPKLGATGLGYELARQFGLEVVEPRPALVPLVLGGDEAGWTELAGVAAEVEAMGRRRGAIQGEDAGDASRAERAGGVAGVFVLASGRGAGGGSCAGDGCAGGADGAGARRTEIGAEARRCARCLPQRLAEYLAETGGPKGWSNAALEACERGCTGGRFIRWGRRDLRRPK